MEQIMSGEGTSEDAAAFLGAFRARGKTASEILGFAHAIIKKSNPVRIQRTNLIDTCGTGGDHSGTFNISTASAFILAGAEVAVAKHGNRAVSSRCGSADVLEALGVKTDLSPEDTARCIDQNFFGFQLAPLYHPGLTHI